MFERYLALAPDGDAAASVRFDLAGDVNGLTTAPNGLTTAPNGLTTAPNGLTTAPNGLTIGPSAATPEAKP
jgi:hypothetical protein